MLYHLSSLLTLYFSGFNIVHYVSFRAMAGLLTSLIISLIAGHFFINKYQHIFTSRYRDWTPENHKQKTNIPTMGGLYIITVIIINILLWCNLTDAHIWLFLLCLTAFGVIGFWDDWCKVTHHKGISSGHKFILQWGVAGIIALAWYYFILADTTVMIPFFKYAHPDIGLLLIPWAMFIMVATSNAVNLTDGLDGLAVGSLLPNFALFSAIAYLAGHALFAAYLHIPFAATAELTIIGSIVIGSLVGFLWYNTHPAQIFMGDVGSLSLGAALALMALMTRHELLLALSGGLFVAETVSVMAQVASVRHRGIRLFKMAPIHHHFELLGWHESKITVRFNIISSILCLLALITLKVR